jgi:pimeloyl-ACP methyl ester carboxylesterase
MSSALKAFKWVGVVLGVAAAAGVAVSWAPDKPVSELTAKWAPAPSQFVQLNGQQVHLRDEGPRTDPEPIVLIHGTSSSLHTWDGWVAGLKAERRVIRMDLPAFGLTGAQEGQVLTQMAYVEFVRSLLDQLGVARAVVAGNSLGGEIAWMLAAHHPERVSKLVLVDAGGYAFPREGMPIGFRLATIPQLKPVVPYLMPPGTIERTVQGVYGDPTRITPDLIERYRDMALREGNRRALFERFAQSKMGAHADEVKQVHQPTLILWGQKDRLIPPGHADKFLADIPGSTAVRFDDLGHVPQEEDAVRTLAPVKAFLGLKP